MLHFPDSCAKTDNFKIRNFQCDPTTCPPVLSISGLKFLDLNANHLFDQGEAVLAGFKIDVTINGVPQPALYTQADGSWAFGPLNSGDSYLVCETVPAPSPNQPYWYQTAPVAANSIGQCYSGTIGSASVTNLNFGNICL